jgi:hypothetical protein
MLVFASPVPAVFSGLDALQSRYSVERPSAEEQYFRALAEEHERAAALARKRMEEARRRQQQQRELEAQLLLQQQLAAAIQVRTPQRSPYHTPPRASFGRTLPCAADVILEFDTEDSEACDVYAERMHRRSQIALLERQKRAEQQNFLRALFEEQRRTQAERVAALHRQRAEEAKAEQERQRKAEQEAEDEQARRHLAARAADEEKLRQFFQALVSAMGADPAEAQGADLERKNVSDIKPICSELVTDFTPQALRRNTVPAPSQDKVQDPAPASASAPASAPVSPKVPERSVSPAPSVASDASDASLNSIALLQDKYNSLRSGFQFPTNLAFAPSTSPITPASSPTLLYNPTNAPVHAYEHALTNLLTELDAVESFGDAHVRDVRRTLVRNVEAELEALEEKKRQAWRDQQEAVVESAPAPAPVESAPIPTPVESVPVSVESAPAPAPTTSTPAPADSEDNEVEAVHESLLARLATSKASVIEFQAALTESATATESKSSNADVVESSQPEAVATESSAIAPESSSEPAVEPVPEPEVVEARTLAPEAESEPVTTESKTETEQTTRPAEPESESAANESVTAPVPTIEPESEVAPSSPVESVPESEVVSVASSSESEVIAKDEAPDQPKPEVQLSVLTQSESEPETAPGHSEEQSAFVQVFPEADSDVDTDADLTSELAYTDKKSTSGGEEFELI